MSLLGPRWDVARGGGAFVCAPGRVCRDALRISGSLGLCLCREGEETGNKEVQSGGEKMNI